MKTLLIALAAGSAIAAAAPAAAQLGTQANTNVNVNARGAIGIENQIVILQTVVRGPDEGLAERPAQFASYWLEIDDLSSTSRRLCECCPYPLPNAVALRDVEPHAA